MIHLRHGEYFAGLFVVAFASGLAARVVHSIEELDLAAAFARTFGINVIVLASAVAGVSLMLRDRTKGIERLDLALGAVFLFLVVLPVGPLSVIAATGLSLYLIATTDVPTSRRGAIILLATTVPLLWSRLLYQFFAEYILAADAILVSLFLGTHRTGNIVDFADKSGGQLAIYPACSSLSNVSLAFLCWIAMSQFLAHRKSLSDIGWCLFACAAVIIVNVARMTILGLSAQSFATFHSGWADAVLNVIILTLIIAICSFGLRHELAKHL